MRDPAIEPAIVINYAGDFRAAAVDASSELLAGTTLDPAEAGVSLCVRAEEDPIATRHVRRGAIASSFGGVAGATIALVTIVFGIVTGPLWLVIAGLGILVIVLILILLESGWRNRIVTRSIRRGRMIPDHPRPICFNVEDGFTFSKVKIAPEDVVLLWADPQRQIVRMEGLTHRYVIHARDVASVKLRWAPGTMATIITYRVRSAELVLVLYENQGNIFEIFKQLVGFPPRRHRMIRNAIGSGVRAAPVPPILPA